MAKEISFGDILIKIRNLKKITRKELSEKSGISPTQIARYENNESEPTLSAISKLAEALEVSNTTLVSPSGFEECDGLIKVPFFNEHTLLIQEGDALVVSDKKIIINVGKDTLVKLNISPEQIACTTIKGNSLNPVLPDKSLIAINTSDISVIDGGIYAFTFSDALLMIKQLYRLPNNKVRIRSFNQLEYPDLEYDLDEIMILGKVFWGSLTFY